MDEEKRVIFEALLEKNVGVPLGSQGESKVEKPGDDSEAVQFSENEVTDAFLGLWDEAENGTTAFSKRVGMRTTAVPMPGSAGPIEFDDQGNVVRS